MVPFWFETKNKIINVIIVLLLCCLITSCKHDTDNNDFPVLESDQVSSSPAEIDGITSRISESPATENNVYEIDIQKKYDSFSDLCKELDLNWNESTEYQNAIFAYDAEVKKIYINSNEDEISSEPHFSYSYIDQDDIPELLVSYGDYHPDGICVYKYDQNMNKVVYLGEYGSFGCFIYFYKHSLIESYYGNMGYYSYYVSRICNDNTINLFDYWIVDGSGLKNDSTIYYHGYNLSPEATGINGSRESFEVLRLNELYAYGVEIEDYEISSEEYLLNRLNWIGVTQDEEITVEYNNMYIIRNS